MPYLISAVVLVGAVGLLNLLLTYGVIRRLREHGEQLSRPPVDVRSSPGPEVGTRVGPFRAGTADGRVVTDAADSVVGFFTTGCRPCAERLPEFVEFARQHDDPDGFLAVLVGDTAGWAADVRALTPVARVVVTERGSDIVRAFGVSGYPVILRVGADGRVSASGTHLSALAPTDRVAEPAT